MRPLRSTLWLAALLWGHGLHAAPSTSLSFSHKDWELACDNTRSCRAAGYHSEESDELPVSLLLTRLAGPEQPIKAELMIGHYDPELETSLKALRARPLLDLFINGVNQGKVKVDPQDYHGELTASQTEALLKALTRSSRIEFRSGKQVWHLSDQGAAAVLLKMDEFQGRLGTPGAVMRKGGKAESSVLPALSPPTVLQAAMPKPLASDASFAQRNAKALRQSLMAASSSDECQSLHDTPAAELSLEVTRLGAHTLLVSTTCWMAAYNMGDGYWLVQDQAPFKAQTITTNANGFEAGLLESNQKGRGLGDCWQTEQWAWTGQDFVQTAAFTTGMCRLVAPGGAWKLSTWVTDLRKSAR